MKRTISWMIAAVLSMWMGANGAEVTGAGSPPFSRPFNGDYHIESTAIKRVKASLDYLILAPDLVAREWFVFATFPPELPSQSNVKASIQGGLIVAEQSSMKRPVIFAQIPLKKDGTGGATSKSVSVRVEYEATLNARKLVTGKPSQPVVGLTKEDRDFCLASNKTCNHESKEVQAWLERLALRRGSAERDLEFAFRAFQRFRKELAYRCDENQSRSASQVCKDRWSDCGGIANLYVATLRANNVPARVLPGRLTTSGEGPSASCHVKSEFYAESIGWIPVEVTSAVAFKSSPDVNFFGVDDGSHLAFHTDTDLIFDTKVAGMQPVPFGQWIHYWVDGSGTWKNHTRKVKWDVQIISNH